MQPFEGFPTRYAYVLAGVWKPVASAWQASPPLQPLNSGATSAAYLGVAPEHVNGPSSPDPVDPPVPPAPVLLDVAPPAPPVPPVLLVEAPPPALVVVLALVEDPPPPVVELPLPVHPSKRIVVAEEVIKSREK